MLKYCNVRGQYLLHCTTVLHILTYKGSFRLFEFWFCLLANIMIFVLTQLIFETTVVGFTISDIIRDI